MKNEIIEKMFASKWNCDKHNVDTKLISLFYSKGGFSGLHDFILLEKHRMDKDKHFPFNNYYSCDLIEVLLRARTELKDNDFEDYIFSHTTRISFNRTNFKKLKEYGLLNYFNDFSDSFRGDIVELHKMANYAIIETYRKGEKHFYNVGDHSTCFNTLEQALLYKIYEGKYFETLLVLLGSLKTKE